MQNEGPLLESLTRRLAECPAEFLAEPRRDDTGIIHIAAVVSDLLQDLGGNPLTNEEAVLFGAGNPKQFPHLAQTVLLTDPAQRRNRLQIVLIAAWLLHDVWFRSHRQFAPPALKFLAYGLTELAPLVKAPALVSDPDRREELARLCLKALDLRPAGETPEQAQDRLTTLSSLERERVIREARAAEKRMQAIREAMARKAAEEAAAKYERE